MYLLRTRQLNDCASRYIFRLPFCLEIILTASLAGNWPPIFFQPCNPSPEMMNTIHTV